MEVQMQMIHNEYLTAEQNAAIEKEIEAEESTLFNPFAELDIELA
jgi:hypothetical protein